MKPSTLRFLAPLALAAAFLMTTPALKAAPGDGSSLADAMPLFSEIYYPGTSAEGMHFTTDGANWRTYTHGVYDYTIIISQIGQASISAESFTINSNTQVGGVGPGIPEEARFIGLSHNLNVKDLYFSGTNDFTIYSRAVIDGAEQGSRIGDGTPTNLWIDGPGVLTIATYHGIGWNYGAAVHKYGAGKVVIAENCSNPNFNSPLYIHQGTYVLDGTLAISANIGYVEVKDGATFGGKGYIGISNQSAYYASKVEGGGTFNPTGMRVANGTLFMEDGSLLKVDFGLGNTALTLTSGGAMDLASGVTLNIGIAGMGADDVWTIVSGLVTGNFDTVYLAGNDVADKVNAGRFTLAGVGDFEIIKDTSGIVLKAYEIVPEPSTYALILGGLGTLALLRRRKS